MNNFVKIGAAFIAGYLVGFYEYKYKATKALMEALVEKEREL